MLLTSDLQKFAKVVRNTCDGVLLIKVTGSNLAKKGLHHRFLAMKFAKVFRTDFSTTTLGE